MHVFIITQYYPPELGASASRWSDYSKILIDQGHKVTILCEAPHYPQNKYYTGYSNHWVSVENKTPGLTVIRSKAFSSNRKTTIKKLSHYLIFMFSAIINSKKVSNFDLLIISSPPLFTGVIGLFLKFFSKKKYFLDIRDLWPESALELGQIKMGLMYNLGKKLELKIYESAEGFIYAIPGFKSYLKSLNDKIANKPMHELMNGVSQDFINKYKSIKTARNDKFTVLYSGNLGLAQDLKTIIKAAKILYEYDIFFKFIGEGVCKSEIKILARPLEGKVRFYDSMPREELIKHIKKASLCLVPLKDKKLFKTALPSKMFEYMACEKPIIVGIRGEARKIVDDSKSGISVEPEDPEMLSDAILNYFKNKEKCKEDGKNGMRYITNNLFKEHLISDVIKKIKNE